MAYLFIFTASAAAALVASIRAGHSQVEALPADHEPDTNDEVDTFLQNIGSGVNTITDDIEALLKTAHCATSLHSLFWMLDNGSGAHISPFPSVFNTPPTTPTSTMFTATGEDMRALTEGTTTCGFEAVKLIPTCHFCIISQRQLLLQSWTIEYIDDTFLVTNPHQSPPKEYIFKNMGGFYFYEDTTTTAPNTTAKAPLPYGPSPLHYGPHLPSVNSIVRTRTSLEFLLWHRRLNHIGYDLLKTLILRDLLKGFHGNIHLIDTKILPKCEQCLQWTRIRRPLKSSRPPPSAHLTRPGMYFAADFKTFSIDFHGHVNAVALLKDAYTKKTFSYWFYHPTPAGKTFLSEIFKHFYMTICEPNQWKHFVYHPDNAKAFISHDMQDFCQSNGILMDPAVPYKPSTNGLAEAAIKVLTNAAACTMINDKF